MTYKSKWDASVLREVSDVLVRLFTVTVAELQVLGEVGEWESLDRVSQRGF